MSIRIAARVAPLLVSAALLTAACATGSSTPAAATAGPSAAAPAASTSAAPAVTIQNFAFAPATITVPVGGTVIWTNQDGPQHTVTADDGSFSSNPLSTGATFSQTFSKAGTFTYHCKIHPSMKATVTVG